MHRQNTGFHDTITIPCLLEHINNAHALHSSVKYTHNFCRLHVGHQCTYTIKTTDITYIPIRCYNYVQMITTEQTHQIILARHGIPSYIRTFVTHQHIYIYVYTYACSHTFYNDFITSSRDLTILFSSDHPRLPLDTINARACIQLAAPAVRKNDVFSSAACSYAPPYVSAKDRTSFRQQKHCAQLEQLQNAHFRLQSTDSNVSYITIPRSPYFNFKVCMC